jgi:prepilin-type processing-associated H-X9-DG protein
MYADDYDDTYPAAEKWMDQVAGLDKDVDPMFHDPGLKDKSQYGYAFRDKASKGHSKTIDKPETFELTFDSTLTTRNAHGETNLLPSPGRHYNANNIGFADGHVKHVEKE